MMKSFKIALLLALLLPVGAGALAHSSPSKSSSSSFKSGFSSQKAASTSSNRSTSSGKSFGSFGSRAATPPPAPPAAAAPSGKSGGFGSFGSRAAAPAPQKSESVLSQGLNKSSAETNAMRTLEARRSAAQAANAPAPVPAQPLPASGNQFGNGHAGMPMPQPIIVQQGGSGMGSLITGFLLGRATSSHNNYPGSYGNSGSYGNTGANSAGINVPNAPHASTFGTSVLRFFAWVLILGVLGTVFYFIWKFLRRGKAPSSANYSFERN